MKKVNLTEDNFFNIIRKIVEKNTLNDSKEEMKKLNLYWSSNNFYPLIAYLIVSGMYKEEDRERMKKEGFKFCEVMHYKDKNQGYCIY